MSWIPNENFRCASVKVEPKFFEISSEQTEIDVWISPKFAGRLREILLFRTENLDGNICEVIVYIRGIVETIPEVNFQPTIAPFSSICAGTMESYDVKFNVKSSGLFNVYRRLYELDDHGTINLLDNFQSFDPLICGARGEVELKFETPLKTKVNRIKILVQNLNEEKKV